MINETYTGQEMGPAPMLKKVDPKIITVIKKAIFAFIKKFQW